MDVDAAHKAEQEALKRKRKVSFCNVSYALKIRTKTVVIHLDIIITLEPHI
jgi:hypothetical protein